MTWAAPAWRGVSGWRAAAVALVLGGLALLTAGLWIPAKAVLAQLLLERAFAASLASGRPVKAWPWADTWPVARIEAPRLKQRVIALEGGSGEAMAFGPGHLLRTPTPGERGTAVFAAHRDTHFAFLGALKLGDEIRVVGRDGRRTRFEVTSLRVVRWNASGIDPRSGGRQIALTTCWPIGAVTPGPMRYVVTGRLIDAATARAPTGLRSRIAGL
ncbi:MAG: class GN sortase [Caulobacter sp.]|nr:class GN sortase [Caulobacter sp.]